MGGDHHITGTGWISNVGCVRLKYLLAFGNDYLPVCINDCRVGSIVFGTLTSCFMSRNVRTGARMISSQVFLGGDITYENIAITMNDPLWYFSEERTYYHRLLGVI